MKTLQVIWNGVEVGTRKSDRPYTWALVAHTFREAEYRARMKASKHTAHYPDEYIDRIVAARSKPSVVSYHGTADLAHGAAGAKRLDWLCCSISVVPVQVKAAKARKSKLAPLAERLQDEGMYTNQLTTKAEPGVVG
jgi:hypothetical protein